MVSLNRYLLLDEYEKIVFGGEIKNEIGPYIV